MSDNLKDFKLPKSVVADITRASLPGNSQIQKDVVSAVGTAASMFILHVTMLSQDLAKAAKKETIQPEHVLGALEEAGFQDFILPLKSHLEAFKNGTNDQDVAEEVDVPKQ